MLFIDTIQAGILSYQVTRLLPLHKDYQNTSSSPLPTHDLNQKFNVSTQGVASQFLYIQGFFGLLWFKMTCTV